jgi:NADH-quinone oxidoreductase subunit H
MANIINSSNPQTLLPLNRWDGGLSYFLATGKLDNSPLNVHLQITWLHLPVWLAWIISMFVMSGLITAFVSVNVMILIWLERKVSGLIQNRMGPMMVGVVPPKILAPKKRTLKKWLAVWFGGWLQTLADGLKLLLKEDIIPTKADKLVFSLAPIFVFTASIMSYALIPFTPNFPVIQNLNIGFLYIFAAGSYTVIGILMAGWGSNNKYSLLGGMRSAAQLISYEIPMVLSLLGIIMMTGSLKIEDIVNFQRSVGNHSGHWFLLYQPIAFVVFLISAIAETNRTPFDEPEAESELVAGFCTEYSGFRFSIFFLSEFANMFLSCALAATLFLGGWSGPGDSNAVVAFLWLMVKTYALVFVFMWVRWTFPRLRVDQLMEFGWKFLTPLALFNLLWTGGEILLIQSYGYHHQYLYIWIPIALLVLAMLVVPKPKKIARKERLAA